MANEKEPTPGTRGWRVDQVRRALGVGRKDLAPLLAEVAADLGIDEGWTWNATRVTNVILERKPMSLDEAASVVALAARRKLKGLGWDWLIFGKPLAEMGRDGKAKDRSAMRRSTATASHGGRGERTGT